MCVFFFFQAEDGIRDLVRSRGLGDVYKRQSITRIAVVADDVAFNSGLMFPKSFLNEEFFPRLKRINDVLKSKGYKILFHSDGDKRQIIPVSYTHLTLPTIYSV